MRCFNGSGIDATRPPAAAAAAEIPRSGKRVTISARACFSLLVCSSLQHFLLSDT